MNNANCLTFITNNIKGIQHNSKRLSVVEYFKNKLGNNRSLFLQERHSTFNDENIWRNDFNVMSFTHMVPLNCDVLVAYFGNSTFRSKNKSEIKTDILLFLR